MSLDTGVTVLLDNKRDPGLRTKECVLWMIKLAHSVSIGNPSIFGEIYLVYMFAMGMNLLINSTWNLYRSIAHYID